MQLITKTISVDELKKMSEKMFDSLVKAVVDIEKGIMVVDAEMHADQEEFLLDQGSEQEYLWGINIYPYRIPGDNWMINLRPSWGNRSRSVENPEIRKKIITLVTKLIIQ